MVLYSVPSVKAVSFSPSEPQGCVMPWGISVEFLVTDGDVLKCLAEMVFYLYSKSPAYEWVSVHRACSWVPKIHKLHHFFWKHENLDTTNVTCTKFSIQLKISHWYHSHPLCPRESKNNMKWTYLQNRKRFTDLRKNELSLPARDRQSLGSCTLCCVQNRNRQAPASAWSSTHVRWARMGGGFGGKWVHVYVWLSHTMKYKYRTVSCR